MLNDTQIQNIIKLRKQNNGYGTIANELDIPKHTVRYYCRKHGLNGKMDSNQFGTIKKREEKFKKKFEDKFSNFKYHSGFKSVDDYFKMKCKKCGHVQEKHAQCLRHSEEIICDNCREIKREKELLNKKNDLRYKVIDLVNKRIKAIKRDEKLHKTCERCGNNFKADSLQRVHCDKCVEEIKTEKKSWQGVIKCHECGKEFEKEVHHQIYCSPKCLNKAMNRIKEIKRREKLRQNGKINYKISLDKLIERDDSTCQLCGKPIDLNDYKMTNEGYFIAGDNYPSLDHVLPVSKGGTHTWDNVQLAHFYCNSIKCNKVKEIS